MSRSSGVPLECVPQLWSADIRALRAIGIATTEDLVQNMHENGLKSLSDSSGIPPKPLKEYLTVAEAFVSEAKTRRRASIMFSLALSVVIALSVSMLTVQAGLLPRSAAKAENAYADLYERYSGVTSLDHADLLHEVTASLKELEGKADSSHVNLLLLSSALNDRIAIEELERAGDDPSSPEFAAHYANYEAYFKKARNEQALIEDIRENDPRIAFARVNSAQAWTSRAGALDKIDVSNLPADDPKRMRIEGEIRHAQAQARREASLAQNTPNIAPELFAQRIDNVRNAVDYQVQQRLPDASFSTEDIEKNIELMQSDLLAMQTNIENLQAEIADLQSPLANLLGLLGDQGIVLANKVDGEHLQTRELIRTVNSSLVTVLEQIKENTNGALPRVTMSGGECGLMEMEKAKETMKAQCNPARGLARSVTFKMGIYPTADGTPRIEVEEGPASNPLDCDLATVMAAFTYDNKEHHCTIDFKVR